MNYFSFTILLLLGALLSCSLASPVAEGHKHKPPKTTKTVTKTRKTCPTTTSISACSFCGGCAPPTAVPVTKTLNWEDIDGLAASRVPIPDNYNDFTHFNPDQNKVYRTGPPPVSVGDGVQVAYANDGKFGLGAQGFVIELKSFWVLTFLDNGVTEATLRVSGPMVATFVVSITTDRQFVQIIAPPQFSNTAVGFYIEIFAGAGVDGPRLPFWLDDLVYVRNLWPATCCQSAGIFTTLDFSDLTTNVEGQLIPYKGFYFQGPWMPVALPTYPSQGPVLHYPSSPQAASITSPVPFSLTRLSIFLPQVSSNPALGVTKHTVVYLTGHGPLGEEISFGWTIASVLFQPAKLDLGGDWTQGGAGPATGYFAATGGFTGINELRILVQEEEIGGGPSTTVEFWLDDFQYQAAC